MKLGTALLLAPALAGCSVEHKSLDMISGRHYDTATRRLTLECSASAQGFCQFSVRDAGVTKTVLVPAKRNLVMPGISPAATFCAQASDGAERDGDDFLNGCEFEAVT